VYDTMDLVPGGRVTLDEVHAQYLEWAKAKDRVSMAKDTLRGLLTEIGLEVKPGRLSTTRGSGRPPNLVHGVVLKGDEPVVEEAKPEPAKKVSVRKKDHKHPLVGQKPGREVSKQIRDLIEPLITEQGWEYQPCNASGRGKPRLITPNGRTLTLPSSPHSSGNSLENTRAFLKGAGAAL
jgi:hypothetical protein